MDNKRIWKHIFCFILGLVVVVPFQLAKAQDQKLNLDVELSPQLENSETLSLTGLGLDKTGTGPILLYGFMENLTPEPLNDLYFEILISSGSRGILAELIQKPNRPFSLQPFQAVQVNNNDIIKNSIPGIQEKLDFDYDITAEGEAVLDDMSGSVALPKDIYSLKVTVFQMDAVKGRTDLATTSTELGNVINQVDEREIYLKAPGDVPGSGAEITNAYPQFSWEGSANSQYRILIIQGNGVDSPQTLLNSAKSSAPTNEGGSLLDFEHADMSITGTNFQFPASGVQPLQKGKVYYWQVLTTTNVSGSQQILESEIWSFKLLNEQLNNGLSDANEELNEMLMQLLGDETYSDLISRGYVLEEMQFDGQLFTGPALIQQIELLLQKIEDEQLILSDI